MLKYTSKDFKKDFLLQFTAEIIRATGTYRSLSIKKQVIQIVHEKPMKSLRQLQPEKKHKKEMKHIVMQKIRRDSEIISQLKEEPFADFFRDIEKPGARKGILPVLQIPESRLPTTVEYLKPFPTPLNINLGKLNPLVKDPLVKIIECNGPEEKIIVMGAMGRKNTHIILKKEEIDSVIETFSEASRIPVQEGMFKAVAGNLIISAIISDVIGSKFIIQKMASRF